MSSTIWKFPLPMYDDTTIRMPHGAEILCVQTQNNEPYIWAIVDDNIPLHEEVLFHIRGTGHRFNGMEGRYVGTFQTFSQLVFHVFRDINVEYEEGNEYHTRRV